MSDFYIFKDQLIGTRVQLLVFEDFNAGRTHWIITNVDGYLFLEHVLSEHIGWAGGLLPLGTKELEKAHGTEYTLTPLALNHMLRNNETASLALQSL